MSYRIITHRDGGVTGNRRQYIYDEVAGAVIAEVVQEEGCKPLIELANRAAKEAAEKARERTERAGAGRVGDHES